MNNNHPAQPTPQEHIHLWIARTHGYLAEIHASPTTPLEKENRALFHLCFLLQEMAATCLPEEVYADTVRLTGYYLQWSSGQFDCGNESKVNDRCK